MKTRVEAGSELKVQFTKRTDGTVVLRCLRADGSSTWQHHRKQAAFFSLHDLSHFAVETTLNSRSGFYGLIADGWDIAETGGKGVRGKLLPASILVEHIVGLFDRERSGGAAPLSAAEFNAQIDAIAGRDPARQPITDMQLVAVRRQIQELHRQWAALQLGSMLELKFNRG